MAEDKPKVDPNLPDVDDDGGSETVNPNPDNA